LDLTTHTSLSPLRRGFEPGFIKKGCTRLAATRDKVYQLLAHGQWFSPGTPASSTTKTGRHGIPEILLKLALKKRKESLFLLLLSSYSNVKHKQKKVKDKIITSTKHKTVLAYPICLFSKEYECFEHN
jgi:hypothetical protein